MTKDTAGVGPVDQPVRPHIAEAGPWEASVVLTGTYAGKGCIESGDFTHDVCLYVDGDFECYSQKLAYAQKIARRLNAWKPDAA